jgi:nitrate/TMAO reductase-like tetraheme cytochrome c subunit
MKFVLLFVLSINIDAKVIIMKHMKEGADCLICHRKDSPQKLLFRNGSEIPALNGDLLCGQCHGIKHRDWLSGVHGKVINSWIIEKQKRVTCIECHDPHSPKFPDYKTKAPVIPKAIETHL